MTDEDLFSQSVKDVYFDYDKADVRGDQQSSIQADAQFLSQHANVNFTIEGHCDERGSTEYNLALGDQRASAVKSALTAAGVSASRIKTISYGKEKPFCTREQRSVLAAEPPRASRLSKVESAGDAVRRPPLRLSKEGSSGVRGREPNGCRLPVESSGSGSSFALGIIPACGTIIASKKLAGILMKPHRISVLLALFSVIWLGVAPAWGVSKDMVQLQTQVQQLQEQMTAMQRSFDERMGVMKNLVEQDTDAVNKVATAFNALQSTLQKQQADGGSKTDQLSGQIQSLNDTLDEIKVRLAKVTKQLEDMQAATAESGGPAGDAASHARQLRRKHRLRMCFTTTGCGITTAPKTILALQEFSDYIKFYPNTDLAGNSYYYLGELQFRQGNFQQAVQSYDQVLQNFPSGNKAASAQLKKGFALLELGKQDDGVVELRHLIQRYPHAPEALQARDRLRKLGVASTGR